MGNSLSFEEIQDGFADQAVQPTVKKTESNRETPGKDEPVAHIEIGVGAESIYDSEGKHRKRTRIIVFAVLAIFSLTLTGIIVYFMNRNAAGARASNNEMNAQPTTYQKRFMTSITPQDTTGTGDPNIQQGENDTGASTYNPTDVPQVTSIPGRFPGREVFDTSEDDSKDSNRNEESHTMIYSSEEDINSGEDQSIYPTLSFPPTRIPTNTLAPSPSIAVTQILLDSWDIEAPGLVTYKIDEFTSTNSRPGNSEADNQTLRLYQRYIDFTVKAPLKDNDIICMSGDGTFMAEVLNDDEAARLCDMFLRDTPANTCTRYQMGKGADFRVLFTQGYNPFSRCLGENGKPKTGTYTIKGDFAYSCPDNTLSTGDISQCNREYDMFSDEIRIEVK